MKLTPAEFLEIIKPTKQTDGISFGQIEPSYASGRPRIMLDGTDTISVKAYPYLSSYTPVANDRVMILKGVVIGKIV